MQRRSCFQRRALASPLHPTSRSARRDRRSWGHRLAGHEDEIVDREPGAHEENGVGADEGKRADGMLRQTGRHLRHGNSVSWRWVEHRTIHVKIPEIIYE